MGTLTFNAFFFENGKVEVIYENSDFIKENGVWQYLGTSPINHYKSTQITASSLIFELSKINTNVPT